MNNNLLRAQVNLIDKKVKMEASVTGKTPVIMDYTPPIGSGEGYTPLEFQLISLATCFGTSVKSLLTGPFKKDILDLSMKIEGDRASEHPTKIENIRLFLNVVSPDLMMEELQRAAKMTEDTYCPVWAMLKGNVTVETILSIEEGIRESQ